MLELRKDIYAHGLGNIHHNHVAGPLYSFRHGKKSVTVTVMAADLVTSDFKKSLTVIGFISGNCTTFNPGRYGKGLGNRARFIRIVNTEVLP